MRSFFSVFVTLALAITVAGSAVPACYDTESDEVTFALSVVGEQAVGPEVIVNPDDEAMILDWKSDVINTHNNARAHYGAGKVTWSDALYPGTLEWAKQCQFKHSNGHYGENLAAGSGSNYGFSNGFKDWMDESKGYNYNEDFQAGKGHFTQSSGREAIRLHAPSRTVHLAQFSARRPRISCVDTLLKATSSVISERTSADLSDYRVHTP